MSDKKSKDDSPSESLEELLNNMSPKSGAVGLGLVVLFMLGTIMVPMGFESIPAGHKGVIMSSPSGPSYDEIDEGWTWKFSYIFSDIHTVRYNMQTTEMVDANSVTVRSSDNLNVVLDVAVVYEFEETKVADIMIDQADIHNIIKNNLRNVPRNIAANYTGEFLGGSGRATVELAIEDAIREKLEPYHVVVNDFMIRDIDLPTTVDRAIEEKKAAEQEVVTAEYQRQRSLIEADAAAQVVEIAANGQRNATIIEANGSSEAVNIVMTSLQRADANLSDPTNAYLTWLYMQALTSQDSNIQYVIMTDGSGNPIMIDLGANNTS